MDDDYCNLITYNNYVCILYKNIVIIVQIKLIIVILIAYYTCISGIAVFYAPWMIFPLGAYCFYYVHMYVCMFVPGSVKVFG